MTNLTTSELQEIVLMTGSKKGLGQYLGLDTKKTDELWRLHELKAPIVWLRAQPTEWLLAEFIRRGSAKEMAAIYGVSASAVKTLMAPWANKPWGDISTLTKENIQYYLARYKSIRLAFRMLSREGWPLKSETELRQLAEKHEINLADLLDWTFSNHSNAKGRRAELEFARMRGDRIKEDCNMTQGSQATTDFVDSELGRVNVKSSRRYTLKAKTRSGDPLFWKFSTSSLHKSDFAACMAYDASMRNLVGFAFIPVTNIDQTCATFILRECDLMKA